MKIFSWILTLLLISFKSYAQQVTKVDCCENIGTKATIITNNNLLVSNPLPNSISNVCNFEMRSSANTSAGVYKITGSDTVLVRTLWSGVRFDVGCYFVKWDTKLDNGTTAPNGNYLIKILKNNVSYKWGLIGNSSKSFTGNEQYNAFTTFYDIAISNNFIYYATGYAERDNQTTKAPLNDLGRRIKVQESANSLSAYNVTTDNNNTYWSGYANNGNKFVFATKQSDDSQVTFTNGTPQTMDNGGITYNSCIGVTSDHIHGLAVNDNFIFVARRDVNTVTAYNKSTGNPLITNTSASPHSMACTTDGKIIWIAKGRSSSTPLTQSYVAAHRLTGASFNSDNGNNTAYAQDNNFNTSDGGASSGAYVGLDLGTAKIVTSIAVVPLTGYAGRLTGALIQGSNTATAEGFVSLFSITGNPTENQYNSYNFQNTTPYRYYRVYTPNSFANVAEFALFDVDPDPVSINQYSIAANGSFSPTGLAVPADETSSISISPVRGELLVVRPDLQQIKIYNDTTGTIIRTIGQLGGYSSNGPAVTNDKFDFGGSAAKFGKDGSLWVSDNGNRRLLHLTATGGFIESISALGIAYFCSVNASNPTQVFQGTSSNMEFTVDYTKDLSTNSSKGWKLANNWKTIGIGPSYAPYHQVANFPNGKTYAKTIPGDLFELRPGVGAVFVGNITGNIEKDGSLWNRNTGAINNITKRLFTGTTSEGMPTWGSAAVVVDATGTSVPFSYNNNTLGATSNSRRFFFYQPNYDPNDPSINNHLGSIKTSNNTVDWLTSPNAPLRYTGPFPPNGYFDQSGHSENCTANIVGANVFWHVNQELGRFTQVAYTNHYNEDGLFIGQFGNDNAKAGLTGDDSFLAGNSFITHAFQIPGSTDIGYIYGDESKHAAVGFVRVSNLGSIQEDIIPVALTGSITPLSPAASNLMANLPYASDDQNAITGSTKWTVNSRSGATAFQTSVGTYGRDSVDVYCKTYNGNLIVSRYLNGTTLNNWRLTGNLLINGNDNNNLEILDINGKIIARLNAHYSHVYLNEVLTYANKQGLAAIFNKISYTYSGGNLVINYLGQNTTVSVPFESGALMNAPGFLRIIQSSGGSDRIIDVYDFRFSGN